MSAYIVNNETISAIVKGFVDYNFAEYKDGKPKEVQIIIDLSKERQRIGQSLLEQNYKSVNYRYNEDAEIPKFEFVDVEVNEGIIYGCIRCYVYQACETDDFFESDIYKSLQRLKEGMLERFISNAGYEAPWGID